jgi:hypothetical protein
VSTASGNKCTYWTNGHTYHSGRPLLVWEDVKQVRCYGLLSYYPPYDASNPSWQLVPPLSVAGPSAQCAQAVAEAAVRQQTQLVKRRHMSLKSYSSAHVVPISRVPMSCISSAHVVPMSCTGAVPMSLTMIVIRVSQRT